MKALKKTYVIVKNFDGHWGYFQDFVSFNKKELVVKCKKFNKEANDKFKADSKKNNLPYIPLIIFKVLNLDEALTEFKDSVASYYSEEDESI